MQNFDAYRGKVNWKAVFMYNTEISAMLDQARLRYQSLAEMANLDSKLNDDEQELLEALDIEDLWRYFESDLPHDKVRIVEQLAIKCTDFRNSLLVAGDIVISRFESSLEERAVDWQSIGTDALLGQPHCSIAPTLQFDLSNSLMMAADSHEVCAKASVHEDLTLEVFEDEGGVVLDVTSENARWDGKVIAVQILNNRKSIPGFVMLRAGASGVVSGGLRINRDVLVGRVEVRHALIDSSDLDSTDVPAIVGAVEHDLCDRKSQSAWSTWLQELKLSDDSKGLRSLIEAVDATLKKTE
jgi:hypothetical protein